MIAKLSRSEVQVHYLLPENIDPTLFTAYERLLSPEEKARRDRYLFEPSKKEYVLTRALVRTVLSHYAPVAPEAWTFSANAHGCPEIAIEEFRSIRFNLSNTKGLIACAVVLDRDVGIDVEDPSRSGETVKVADHFFSPPEIEALGAVSEAERRSRFFDFWTLKEAYIKARGMGLALPLAKFSFVLSPGAPIRIAIDPALNDDPTTWQFEKLALSPRHHAAAAVRRGREANLEFCLHPTVPLVSHP